MVIEFTLSRGNPEQFLNGVPNHEIEVLDIENMKIKDYINIFILDSHVLQIPNSSRIFPEEI